MSYFHSVFTRHMNIATQILENKPEYTTQTQCEMVIGDFADLIQGFYINGTTYENIILVTLYIDDVPVQSFTGEWIKMYHYLRTPRQKRPLIDGNYLIVPFKKYLPIFKNSKVVVLLNTPASITFFVDYVFLDKKPKDANLLIEQVQMVESNEPNVYLGFKRPVKELYITADPSIEDITRIRLDINEFTKIDEVAMYFRFIQPLDYHTSVPGTFFTYSFCLDPESEFPTGSINMGRVKNQTLRLTYPGDKTIRVYAHSFNILDKDGKLLFT